MGLGTNWSQIRNKTCYKILENLENLEKLENFM